MRKARKNDAYLMVILTASVFASIYSSCASTRIIAIADRIDNELRIAEIKTEAVKEMLQLQQPQPRGFK